MGMQKLLLQPGLNTQATQLLNQAGWSLGNLIRFKDGLTEKIGGWMRISDQPCIGTVTALHDWEDLNGITYLAFGSEQRLQVYSQGAITDITPIRRTVNTANMFSTVATSAEVNVHDVANGASLGDSIIIPIPVAIGGLLIQGNYTVDGIIDADHYTFNAGAPATATVNNAGTLPTFSTLNTSNVITVALANHGETVGSVFTVQVSLTIATVVLLGDYLVDTVIDANSFTFKAATTANATAGPTAENSGNIRIQYLLTAGNANDTSSAGWGTGTYGSGTWGTSSGSGAQIPHRDWFLDNFGQVLMAVPTNGPLYEWTPPVAPGNEASVVTQAPSVNAAMFLPMPQAQVIMLGSSVAGVQDPLLIAWSDAGDFTVWTATAANQAGTFRLPRGARIIGGLQGPLQGYIWTDVEVWGSQYIGPPFIYSFTSLGRGVGLIAAKAAAVLSDEVYWMSTRGFYMIGSGGGAPTPLPCAVFDKVFGQGVLNSTQQSKIFAAPNSLFNEVSWFFPALPGLVPDSYVKYNRVDKVWDYGKLIRTAWLDQNVFGPPLAVDGNRLIQQHEVGTDNDGAPMTGVYIESGFADLSSGEEMLFIDQLIPDFVWGLAANQALTVTVYVTGYPGTPTTTYGPYTITNTSQYITLRNRGRQVAIKIQSDGIGVFWRIGAIRYRGAPDGRNP